MYWRRTFSRRQTIKNLNLFQFTLFRMYKRPKGHCPEGKQFKFYIYSSSPYSRCTRPEGHHPLCEFNVIAMPIVLFALVVFQDPVFQMKWISRFSLNFRRFLGVYCLFLWWVSPLFRLLLPPGCVAMTGALPSWPSHQPGGFYASLSLHDCPLQLFHQVDHINEFSPPILSGR